jgi:DNA polymerase-3 subunit gamma/tau
MSYLVLARKYRPQTFADLVGQEHVTRTLTNAIKLGRIAHGYLFTGTRGVGKTTVARIFAKSLNCESAKGPTPTPCGTCPACKEIAASTHPDVFEIDAASNTSVDDVRELRENAKYLPARARFKVYIIDEVHMLSRSAFNALLKTLEEPPAHVIFLFATTEPHRIPDTVLSRTQQFEFKMIGLGEIAGYLKRLMAAEKIDVPADVLMLVARKAAGSVRDGLSYMDQVLSFGPDRPLAEIAEVLGVVDRQTLLDISAAVLRADPVAVLDALEKLGASNWDVKDLLADLLEHFRNLIAVKLARKPERLIDAGDAELAALAAQVKNVEIETLEHVFQLFSESEELILRSGQPRLVLEMTLVRLAQGAKVTSLNRLIDLLIEWKGSAPSGGAAPAGSAGSSTAPVRPPVETERAEAEPTVATVSPPVNPSEDPRGALVQAFKQSRPTLAAALADNPVELRGDQLWIVLSSSFARKTFEREAELVNRIARQLFGEKVTLKIALADNNHAAANPVQEQWQARKAAMERQRALEKETLAHPAVQWARELFPEAEVRIKSLEPEEKN